MFLFETVLAYVRRYFSSANQSTGTTIVKAQAERDLSEHVPDRRMQMLNGLDLAQGIGLEIGALCRPLVVKSESEVYYVDYADAGYLRERYANDPNVDVDQIVDVDFLWGERDLRTITGERAFDYIIASHVIEHVPDLITWLDELRSVLKPSGSIRLAIPDRRYTFDFLRRESRFVDLLDAYLRRARRPLPSAILDHRLNTAHVDCAAAWISPPDPTLLQRYHSYEQALECARNELEHGLYDDVHCWVFTPASLIDLFEELSRHGLLELSCERLVPTLHNQLEFFVALRPSHDREDAIASWQAARCECERADKAVASCSSTPGRVPCGPDEIRRLAGPLRALMARAAPIGRLAQALSDSSRYRGGLIPMGLSTVGRIRREGWGAQWRRIRCHARGNSTSDIPGKGPVERD